MEGIDVTWLDVEEIVLGEEPSAQSSLVVIEVSKCAVCGVISGEYLGMIFYADR